MIILDTHLGIEDFESAQLSVHFNRTYPLVTPCTKKGRSSSYENKFGSFNYLKEIVVKVK